MNLLRAVQFGTLTMLLAPQAFAQIVITEIMYDPKQQKDAGHEWIEILNDNETSVDVTAYRLAEGKTNHHLKESSTGVRELAAGGVGVIVQDEDVFLQDHPTYDEPMFLSIFNLRQRGGQGEEIGIYNPGTKETISSFHYTPDENASGTGATLHITDGEQVSGPATPGSIEVNPITVKNTAGGPEAVREEPEPDISLEQRVSDTVSAVQTIVPVPQTVIQRVIEKEVAIPPPPITVVNTIPEYHTPLMKGILVLLTVIVAELLLILTILISGRRKERYQIDRGILYRNDDAWRKSIHDKK